MSLNSPWFVHPSESTASRFVLWLLLSGLGTALLAQLFGPTIGGFEVFFPGVLVLCFSTSLVTPPAQQHASFSFEALIGLVVFLGCSLAVILTITLEPYLRSLPIWGTSAPRRPLRLPLAYQVLLVSTWLAFVAFECWRFAARRKRPAA